MKEPAHGRIVVEPLPHGSIERTHVMITLVLNLPTFGFVVATRAALGVGIGLLLSERLPAERRRALGVTLVAIGAASTIPAVMAISRGRHAPPELGRISDPSRL